MSNNLKNEISPYLLQHAENPVNWYPWCEEAFSKAKSEDKPIFLSIGYSTCHWCHVMAHESFEDNETANLLNDYFVSIKVDKEERPDIDSIYMSVCQAFTGGGGWPMSIFMTSDQKPFFAGTYFPKTARYGSAGFIELLEAIHESWKKDRKKLLKSADSIVDILNGSKPVKTDKTNDLIASATEIFKNSFDEKYGGFGNAPKFPTPHNLIFLLQTYEKSGDKKALEMAEITLKQMYRGGIFDHIGYGFSRYSTDRYFLVPHFEKMLYDNALLILAYCKCYSVTKDSYYLETAEKTAQYVIRDMASPLGGFFSAQDADSEGEEGKFYTFTPEEIINILGDKVGEEFNTYFSITNEGNFEGKSIPNLLRTAEISDKFEKFLPKIIEFRKSRAYLHLDDKILTLWNSLMIAALTNLYQISNKKKYLKAAQDADQFINNNLYENGKLFVSFRNGEKGKQGFFDDYAGYIFALLNLYTATLEKKYIERAETFCQKATEEFLDPDNGGFFMYGSNHEQLILRPKETYDGAIPSGNSIMSYNLVRLWYLTGKEKYKTLAKQQLDFMSEIANEYSAGYSMFLIALSDYLEAPEKIIVVSPGDEDIKILPCKTSPNSILIVKEKPTEEYPLKNSKTTYYVCKNRSCQPPVNELI